MVMTHGLVPQDILDCYPGTSIEDFNVTGDVGGGDVVVISEIELQAQRLLGYLPTRLRALLKRIPGEQLEVWLDTDPDPDEAWFETALPAQRDSLVVYGVRGPVGVDCRGALRITDQDAVEVEWDEGEGRWRFVDLDTYNPDLTYIATYLVDQQNVIISTLRALLRDMVACALGRRLFANQSDDWGQVTYHCDAAKELLAHIKKDRNWTPPELEGRVYLLSPIIRSIPIYRG